MRDTAEEVMASINHLVRGVLVGMPRLRQQRRRLRQLLRHQLRSVGGLLRSGRCGGKAAKEHGYQRKLAPI